MVDYVEWINGFSANSAAKETAAATPDIAQYSGQSAQALQGFGLIATIIIICLVMFLLRKKVSPWYALFSVGLAVGAVATTLMPFFIPARNLDLFAGLELSCFVSLLVSLAFLGASRLKGGQRL